MMDLWDTFVEWVNSIPAVVWSGAIGALLASAMSYAGIRSANNSSYKRLRAQHAHDKLEADKQRAHDANQKEEDRKAAIRREVYTEAVEQAHATLAAIGGFVLKPIDYSGTSDTDALQKFLAANSKVWLVAESEAAHLSRDLAKAMGEHYLTTLASAYPLRLAYSPIWEINRNLIHAESEVQRIITKIADLDDPRRGTMIADPVHQSLVSALSLVEALKKQRTALKESITPQQLAHVRKLTEDLEPLQKILVQLVSSLRKEIHLPPDEAEFLKQMADMKQGVLDTFERLFGPAPS